MATFLKIVLFYFKRCCIWLKDALYVCCRDFLCNALLPSRSIVPSTSWNGCVLMFWIKQCIFTCLRNKANYLIEMKSDKFKKSYFFGKECYILKGILFLLKECYTLWMKVFVCKACSCQLELLLQERCMLDLFCSNYTAFTTFFRFWNHSSLLNGNFAERWRWIEDWRLKIEGLGKTCSIHMPTKLKFWIEEILFQAFNFQS